MKKSYIVKRYKGNILESLKRFEEKYPNIKILEAIEDGNELKIKGEAADDFPQGKYFQGEPNESLRKLLLSLFDTIKYSKNKNKIKTLRMKWQKELAAFRKDKTLNDIFSEKDWNAEMVWVGGVDNHLAAVLSCERVLGKDKCYVVLDDGRALKQNPISKNKWDSLYSDIRYRQNPKIPEWDPK